MTNVEAPQPQIEPHLHLPLYGASFAQSVRRFFKKFATFHGRASRSEYWWVQLFILLVQLVPLIVIITASVRAMIWADHNGETWEYIDESGVMQEMELDAGIMNAPGAALLITLSLIILVIIEFALLVPTLALTWRRLHDANLPGPLFFLSFLPYAGALVLIVLTLLPSRPEGARFDRVSMTPGGSRARDGGGAPPWRGSSSS